MAQIWVWVYSGMEERLTLKEPLRDWNETWYLCSYQCWYFDVDRKWPTVEVMVYIETLWENMFIFFRTTEQTLARFGRTFPNEVWHSSHMTSDILMVNIWRFFSQQHLKGFECILYYMYLLMRRSWLIFHGSKHGGMNIYFVIYLEKIQKHISKKIVGSKVVRTS